MAAHEVADVGEVGPLWFELVDDVEGFGQGKMGDMGLDAEGVEDKYLQALQEGHGGGGNVVGVGDIGEVADAETQYWEAMVHDGNGNEVHASGHKGLAVDLVEHHRGHAGIFLVGEDIREFLVEGVDGDGIGEDVHGNALAEVEGPDVVHASDMVFVVVGKDDGVQLLDLMGQHLLAEIGAGVNDAGLALGFQEYCTAEAGIVGVWGGADITIAGDHGNALGGASAKEGELHDWGWGALSLSNNLRVASSNAWGSGWSSFRISERAKTLLSNG